MSATDSNPSNSQIIIDQTQDGNTKLDVRLENETVWRTQKLTLETSILFFKTVQNKMHWAITGQTAAEIVASRADSQGPNMGLTNWRGSKVRKQDVAIAKNYLSESELSALNNLVEQYLVFAEGQAM